MEGENFVNGPVKKENSLWPTIHRTVDMPVDKAVDRAGNYSVDDTLDRIAQNACIV